jgi:hypothetical protein
MGKPQELAHTDPVYKEFVGFSGEWLSSTQAQDAMDSAVNGGLVEVGDLEEGYEFDSAGFMPAFRKHLRAFGLLCVESVAARIATNLRAGKNMNVQDVAAQWLLSGQAESAMDRMITASMVDAFQSMHNFRREANGRDLIAFRRRFREFGLLCVFSVNALVDAKRAARRDRP